MSISFSVCLLGNTAEQQKYFVIHNSKPYKRARGRLTRSARACHRGELPPTSDSEDED